MTQSTLRGLGPILNPSVLTPTGGGIEHMVMLSNAAGSASPVVVAANGLADIPVPYVHEDTDSYVSAVDPAYPIVIPTGLAGIYHIAAALTFRSTTSDPTSGFVWATITASVGTGGVWGDVADARLPFGVWRSSNELMLSGYAELYETAKLELFISNKTNASVTFDGTFLQSLTATLIRATTPSY